MSIFYSITYYIKNDLNVFKSKNKYIKNELKDATDINSE